MSDKPMRRVVCAALKKGDRIICGPRHFDECMRNQIASSEGSTFWVDADQGFVDQWGVYMDRKEAREVAWNADQVRRRCGGDTIRLFSENLY